MKLRFTLFLFFECLFLLASSSSVNQSINCSNTKTESDDSLNIIKRKYALLRDSIQFQLFEDSTMNLECTFYYWQMYVLSGYHTTINPALIDFGKLPPYKLEDEFGLDYPCCDTKIELFAFDTMPSQDVFDKMERLCSLSKLDLSDFDHNEEGGGIWYCNDKDGWYKNSGNKYVYVVHLVPHLVVKFYNFERGSAKFTCETHFIYNNL